MNSIRISDHKGYEHLKYKYNVILGLTWSGWKKDNDKWRYYCSTAPEQLKKLISIIYNDKINRKAYGKYNELIDYYKNNRNKDISFWKSAKEVKLDEPTRITEADN